MPSNGRADIPNRKSDVGDFLQKEMANSNSDLTFRRAICPQPAMPLANAPAGEARNADVAGFPYFEDRL